jgi:hypothetical protein
MEIQLLREEIRSLHRQFAQKVLLDKLGKHGTDLSDGATPGNQIRRAIGLMGRPITEALEKGSAPEALELWRLHSELLITPITIVIIFMGYTILYTA